MFKSGRVHLSSEQEKVQISWAGVRTNVGMYTRSNFSFNSTVGEDVILNLSNDLLHRQISCKQLASPRRCRSGIWKHFTGVFRSDGRCYQDECRLLRRNHEFGVGSLRGVYWSFPLHWFREQVDETKSVCSSSFNLILGGLAKQEPLTLSLSSSRVVFAISGRRTLQPKSCLQSPNVRGSGALHC